MNQKEVPIHVPRATTLPSVLPLGLLPANDREKVRWWAPILAVGMLLGWPLRRLGVSIHFKQYVGTMSNRRYMHLTWSWPCKTKKED